MILICGALLGFISVAFGAFAEHSLQAGITDEQFRYLMTGIRYNQIHAVLISAIGLGLLSGGTLAGSSAIKWSAALFIIGTICFSFGIYLSVWLNIPNLVYITPVGGTIIMVAWLTLSVSGFMIWKKQSGR